MKKFQVGKNFSIFIYLYSLWLVFTWVFCYHGLMNNTPHSSEFCEIIAVITLSKQFQVSLERIVSNYLKWVPIIFSDFVCSYSGIRSLIFENGRYCIGFYDGSTEPLSIGSQKSLLNSTLALFEFMLIREVTYITQNYSWIPHYKIYIDPDSWQSQSILEFRMRESWQVVKDIQAAVIANYE